MTNGRMRRMRVRRNLRASRERGVAVACRLPRGTSGSVRDRRATRDVIRDAFGS